MSTDRPTQLEVESGVVVMEKATSSNAASFEGAAFATPVVVSSGSLGYLGGVLEAINRRLSSSKAVEWRDSDSRA